MIMEKVETMEESALRLAWAIGYQGRRPFLNLEGHLRGWRLIGLI